MNSWPGGTATELAIYPDHGQMQNKDFIWRLGKLAIRSDEAIFTDMEEYDRKLMVLEGETVLSFGGQRTSHLQAMDVESFDGGVVTKSFGRAICYDLLVRKGCRGLLDKISLEPKRMHLESIYGDDGEQIAQGFYCCSGYAVVAIGSETCMVKEGEQLIVNYPADEVASLGIMGEGTVIRTQIVFREMVLVEEKIPEAKASFRDLIDAAAISMTNFRGSRLIFRYLKNIWYDEELKRGIHKIERFYLPMLLWFAGICGVAFWGVDRLSPEAIFLLIGAWSLVVFCILSPLLYFLVLPKPIRAHIKRLDLLTDYEKGIVVKEQEANPQADKILKRYKISGRNVYLPDKPKKKK